MYRYEKKGNIIAMLKWRTLWLIRVRKFFHQIFLQFPFSWWLAHSVQPALEFFHRRYVFSLIFRTSISPARQKKFPKCFQRCQFFFTDFPFLHFSPLLFSFGTIFFANVHFFGIYFPTKHFSLQFSCHNFHPPPPAPTNIYVLPCVDIAFFASIF